MDGRVGCPKKRERVPVVLSRTEVSRLLGIGMIEGIEGDLARLPYGTGMRLMEGLRLRVKDLDFDRNEIVVREGKGTVGALSPLDAIQALAGVRRSPS